MNSNKTFKVKHSKSSSPLVICLNYQGTVGGLLATSMTDRFSIRSKNPYKERLLSLCCYNLFRTKENIYNLVYSNIICSYLG